MHRILETFMELIKDEEMTGKVEKSCFRAKNGHCRFTPWQSRRDL
jgi:hypothetical protein